MVKALVSTAFRLTIWSITKKKSNYTVSTVTCTLSKLELCINFEASKEQN